MNIGKNTCCHHEKYTLEDLEASATQFLVYLI